VRLFTAILQKESKICVRFIASDVTKGKFGKVVGYSKYILGHLFI